MSGPWEDYATTTVPKPAASANGFYQGADEDHPSLHVTVGEAAPPAGSGDTGADGPWKDYGTADDPAADAPKPNGFMDYWKGEILGAGGRAVDKLKTDIGAGIEAAKSPAPDLKGAVDHGIQGLARTGSILMDAVNVPLSPFAGAFHGAVTRPYGAVMSHVVPGSTPAEWEDTVNTAMMAAGPDMKMIGAPVAGADAAAAAATLKPPVLKAPGPVAKIVEPFAARFSPKAVEQQAGRTLATRASDPAAAQAALAGGPQEIVPGSVPTTFQQTGDMGLGSLEREVATRNPAEFNQRRADQNVARVDALKGVQSGGDPVDVAKAFRQHIDELDAQTEGDVTAATGHGEAHVAATDAATGNALEAATAAARAGGEAVGGMGTPEGYGADIRTRLDTANEGAKAQVRKLHDAIDPEGTLTGNMTGTKQAAKAILAEIGPTTMPMTADEAAVFKAAAEMPDVAPARQLLELNKFTNKVLKAAGKEQGPDYARLSRLRNAIGDTLDRTIGDRIAADDVAVQAGTMAPGDAVGAQWQKWRDEFYTGQQTARTGTSDGAGVDAGGGPRPIPRAVRAEMQGRGQSGDAAGTQGVSSPPEVAQPTFDAEAAARAQAASTAHAERKQTFGIQPIQGVLKTNGFKGQFVMPDGQVPAKFFHTGPAAFEHINAALKASPDALPVLEDYAAMSVRRAAMDPETGVMDPAKFERWSNTYRDALRALPEATRARFASAAEAGRAVGDAAVARAEAMKSAQAKAAEDVAAAVQARKATMKDAQSVPGARLAPLTEPEDIAKTVGSILGGNHAVADMMSMAAAARPNPEAFAGLRQAVVDHILTKYIGNTEIGTSGVSGINANAFQTFIKAKRGALSTILSPDEIASIEAIAADIQRAKRSENAVRLSGGSNTAQDIIAATKDRPAKGSRSVMDIIVGAFSGLHFGVPGAIAGAFGADFVQGLRTAGINNVDQLVTRAMLDPKLAHELLSKVLDGSPAATATAAAARSRSVMKALGAGLVANDVNQSAKAP